MTTARRSRKEARKSEDALVFVPWQSHTKLLFASSVRRGHLLFLFVRDFSKKTLYKKNVSLQTVPVEWVGDASAYAEWKLL